MNNDLLQPIWTNITSFIKSHPFLWFIIVVIIVVGFSIYKCIQFLASAVPQVDVIKSKIIIPVAKKLRHKKLVKEAIKSDIKGHVNLAVRQFQSELPSGWIKEMDIKWVERESIDDFLEENDIVIRMMPLEDQDRNFVTATYYFFRKAFFPKTKRVIPEIYREATILHMCRRLINVHKKNLQPVFEDYILEAAIQKRKGILRYLERYDYIDKRGFFTGTFLREIQEIATIVRFNPKRNEMYSEASEILKHIEGFIKDFGPDKRIPPGSWYRFGPVTSYSFLLVAHPAKVSVGVKFHLKRAKEKLDQGAQRLYIFGNAEETKFTNMVIEAISRNVPGYKLIEKFDLYRDYRGNKGGIGALFVVNKSK